jgi:ribosomal protein S27AE
MEKETSIPAEPVKKISCDHLGAVIYLIEDKHSVDFNKACCGRCGAVFIKASDRIKTIGQVEWEARMSKMKDA